jgi:hypothetical protein
MEQILGKCKICGGDIVKPPAWTGKTKPECRRCHATPKQPASVETERSDDLTDPSNPLSPFSPLNPAGVFSSSNDLPAPDAGSSDGSSCDPSPADSGGTGCDPTPADSGSSTCDTSSNDCGSVGSSSGGDW